MLKRYVANKDNTISNAFKNDLITRATGSNMGLADSCEIFHIYGQASSASHEYSRALFEFPISTISSDRTNSVIPNSGSVSYYLRLFNAEHPFTIPNNYYLSICALTKSWDEGWGKDCDEYSDYGISNWTQASSASSGISSWDSQGGDYFTGSYTPGVNYPCYSYYFDIGDEDVELDVTSLVEEWIAGRSNCGIIVALTSSTETALSSSYTKKFYTRGSEYFFKKPIIEARWDDSKKDNRGNFYASSSLVSTENINTLYLYNFVKGQLRNIPSIGTGAIYVQMWTDSLSGSNLNTTPITGGYVSKGIYSASFALNTSASYVYDRWYSAGLSTCYHTGSRIKVNTINSYSYNVNPKYIISIPNLKSSYDQKLKERIQVFTRDKSWKPNKYTVMQADTEFQLVEDLYYRVKRVKDNEVVVDYGTGSINHTRLSYDVSGSYFDFDFENLDSGYMYEFSFIKKTDTNDYEEMKNKFKFRVD